MPALAELNTNTLPARDEAAAESSEARAKRKRPDEPPSDPSDSNVSANFDNISEHRPYKWNCSQIRTKINALIRSGEMKVTHFQKELEINSNSHGRFMKYKGPYGGSDNSTYHEAHKFFLRREARGIMAPRAKKARTKDLHKFDVTGIQLPKEADDEVEVFDTCDDVQSKIQAHLREPGITLASFCREIAKTYSSPAQFQSKQIADFLHKKGPLVGNTSSVYYASYVFFEKLRLKNSQPKSQKRKSVETVHPYGMERDRRSNGAWCPAGAKVYEDQFGRVSVH